MASRKTSVIVSAPAVDAFATCTNDMLPNIVVVWSKVAVAAHMDPPFIALPLQFWGDAMVCKCDVLLLVCRCGVAL